ncbi:hypothetical protein [Dyella subtropica]|uniref:hypothetical protein n=1 Tax=Dyella subtropica TaxID=2992127 RepID=UPI00224F63DF|nr:hypothetical protein [Dyella subtropica]
MHPIHSAVHSIFVFVVLVLAVVPIWKIVSKAGYHGAWSLLMFVPLVNLIMLYVFAFNTWPMERGRTP